VHIGRSSDGLTFRWPVAVENLQAQAVKLIEEGLFDVIAFVEGEVLRTIGLVHKLPSSRLSCLGQ
jgi:hypothetical protein